MSTLASPLKGAFANDRLDKTSTPSLGVEGSVDLYWLPLGAGGRSVRLNGRVFEWLSALRAHRSPLAIYHAALEVLVDEGRYVIEMTPEGKGARERQDVVAGGARQPLGRTAPPISLRAPLLARRQYSRRRRSCWKPSSSQR